MSRVWLRARPRSGGAPIGRGLLARVGFTNHAIARFAERAALGSTNRRVIEPILRELLLDEGRVMPARPVWAASRHEADLFLQLGDWMLLVGCRDRVRADRYAIVTVINGSGSYNWRTASRHGLISAPPPMPGGPPRPSLAVSIAHGLTDRRPGEGRLAAVGRTHRARRELAQARYDRALLERWRGRDG
jgi:hypothetical protein